MLDDPQLVDGHSTEAVERIVLLTGKIYYDLVKERATRPAAAQSKVAIIRIEELAPFPFQHHKDTLARYGGNHVREVCWLQEEPRNQGAWTHVAPRIRAVLEQLEQSGNAIVDGAIGGGSTSSAEVQLRYIGRKEDAVPAVGVGKVYKAQQNAVVHAAFEGL